MITVSEDVLKKENKFEEFKMEFIEFVLKFCRVRLDIFQTNLKESFFSQIKNKFIEMNFSKEINENNIIKLEYNFFKRVMSSKNYLEFFNKEKAEFSKNEMDLRNKLSKAMQLNKKYAETIKLMKESNSWKITKPLRMLKFKK
jgi:hypothetical protein